MSYSRVMFWVSTLGADREVRPFFKSLSNYNYSDTGRACKVHTERAQSHGGFEPSCRETRVLTTAQMLLAIPPVGQENIRNACFTEKVIMFILMIVSSYDKDTILRLLDSLTSLCS